jgi:hypothetical protein
MRFASTPQLMKAVVALSFLLFSISVFAQKPSMVAIRTTSSPKIDGKLDDSCWKNVKGITLDRSYRPKWDMPASQKTVFKLIYDNTNIYVGVMLYDNDAKKIYRQLTPRDGADNYPTDDFSVGFDPYHTGLNAYRFFVSAANVQSDAKSDQYGNKDYSWDGVWESAVNVTDSGWSCEMRIPYSMLRFPSSNVQTWGLEFTRDFARAGEQMQWSLINPKINGYLSQWGTLTGLENITPPVRLSLSPYLTAGMESSPSLSNPSLNSTSALFSAGADLKYGVNESFTLDATLIPDFGQVQSDNLVLNISPFETKFDEKRPFFTEGTELFNQDPTNGNNGNQPQIFYSRRIGDQPEGYYDVYSELQPGEEVIADPSVTKLYNAIKFSGRTNTGLGIGILNAVTQPMYAVVEDSETHKTRDVLTNPLTNYNVIVFDQALKNNSKVSLENLNTLRDGEADDANVTSIHYDLKTKGQAYDITGFSNYSLRYGNDLYPNPYFGFDNNIQVARSTGKLLPYAWNEIISPHYDDNDLGISFYQNQMTTGGGYNYNNSELKSPTFIRFQTWFSTDYQNVVSPEHFILWEGNFGAWTQTKTTSQYSFNFYAIPEWNYNFYEPRTPGRYWKANPYFNLNLNFNSDYRKKLTYGFSFNYGDAPGPDNPYLDFTLFPTWRFNDHLTIGYIGEATENLSNHGYVTNIGDTIIFGRRNTYAVSQELDLTYIFNPKMNITFRARYYWSQVNYLQYYTLENDGTLGYTSYTGNNDINYNVFNIDAVYAWEFAPGSYLNLIWKNSIFQSDDVGNNTYWDNFQHTFATPQTNGLSLKIIYYLDYNSLRNRG